MDDPGLLKEGSGISGFWPPQVFRVQHSGLLDEVSYCKTLRFRAEGLLNEISCKVWLLCRDFRGFFYKAGTLRASWGLPQGVKTASCQGSCKATQKLVYKGFRTESAQSEGLCVLVRLLLEGYIIIRLYYIILHYGILQYIILFYIILYYIIAYIHQDLASCPLCMGTA